MGGMTSKFKSHRPFHIYYGHTYFLTGPMLEGSPYLYSDERKLMFQNVLKEASERFEIGLFSWVVLHNHYHLLFRLHKERNIELSPQAKFDHNEGEFRLRAQFSTPLNSKQREKIREEEQKHRLVEFVRKLHKDTALATKI